MHDHAAAPWSKALKVMSVFSVLLIGVVFFFATRTIPAALHGGLDRRLAWLLPVAIVGGAALFVVGGYELRDGVLRVRRLLWATRVPLLGLDRAWSDPLAMKGSLRLFGNGGLFSVTGFFQSKSLGRYRAFVTDPSKSVVLKSGSRTVVISPADPEEFLHVLQVFFPNAVFGSRGDR